MMQFLIEYIKSEGNCTAARAEEIAWEIVDSVDEMIHNIMEDDEDECD